MIRSLVASAAVVFAVVASLAGPAVAQVVWQGGSNQGKCEVHKDREYRCSWQFPGVQVETDPRGLAVSVDVGSVKGEAAEASLHTWLSSCGTPGVQRGDPPRVRTTAKGTLSVVIANKDLIAGPQTCVEAFVICAGSCKDYIRIDGARMERK